MAPVRPGVQLLLIVAVAAAAIGACGGDERPRPGRDDALVAQRAAAHPLYWAGSTVAGLPLTAISPSNGAVSFLYGTCEPSGDSGCGAPATIQTTSICDRNALTFDGPPPRSSRRVRGVLARFDAEGTVEIAAGTSAITVFTNGARIDRVLAALHPVRGTPRGERLPRPRYPREYVLELRRVRDAFRRTGSVRAVRDELGISQRAVRFRLRLARELGSARLRRPAAGFTGKPCAVEPAR